MIVAFGIVSSLEPGGSVGQLVRALDGEGPIVVHHDYSKQRDFRLPSGSAFIVPDFVETGWGDAGFCRAVFHLIRSALERFEFDYLQLLSGSCLPVRPVAELRRFLDERGDAIHADLINVDLDEEAHMSHGFRIYAPAGTLAASVLRRSRRWYFAGEAHGVSRANLRIEVPKDDGRHGRGPRAWLIRQLYAAARAGLLGSHPFRGRVAPYVGSMWFCLRRDVCRHLVDQERLHPVLPFLRGAPATDEILFPTLLGNAGFGIAPSNHFVSEFVGAHPRAITAAEMPAIRASERFFARKFSRNPEDPVRRIALDLACGSRRATSVA